MGVPTANRRDFVKRGQLIRSVHHNQLVTLAEQITIQQGRLKGRRDPDGFSPRINATGTTSVDYAFRITPGVDNDGNLTLTFTPAHVGGVIPQINGLSLDDTDDNGDPPALVVKDSDFAARGNVDRTLVMFRYDLDHSVFSVQKVTPFIAPKPPDLVAWVWNKLVAIIVKTDSDTRIWPQVFFAQYFDVVNPKPSGGFQPLPHTA